MIYVGQKTEASITVKPDISPKPSSDDPSSDAVPTTEELLEHADAVRLPADVRWEASESSNYRLGTGRYLAP